MRNEKPAAVTAKTWLSPCGPIELAATGSELVMSDWVNGWHRKATLARMQRLLKTGMVPGINSVIEQAKRELEEFFGGARRTFSVPVRLVGTPFQIRVWNALGALQYGEVTTYGELAARIGMPGAVRAVANAVGANPLSIIVPCHRVIGADGTLTGYGGGYPAKRRLLAIEAGVPESALPWPEK